MVITEITMHVRPETANAPTSLLLYSGALLPRPSCDNFIGGAQTNGHGFETVVDPLGTGAAIPAGATINARAVNTFGFGSMRGYLVPGALVATAGTAEAAMLYGPVKSPPLPRR